MNDFGHPAINDHPEPPIRMDGVAYCELGVCHPFNAAAPMADDWRLYVIRGEGVAFEAPDLVDGGCVLQNGTVIGMAGSAAHRFLTAEGDRATFPASAWDERPLAVHTPDHDTNEDAIIAIGRIPQSSLPFLSLMGGFIRIDPREHGDVTGRIGALMDWIAAETARNDPVTGTIVLRLAEIITIEIGRIGRAQSVLFSRRPLDADYDVRIWRAIAAICSEPQRHWTVETMAQVAGMSRSAFAARYHETVGQTPMRSLRRLRMHRAAITLAATGPHSIAPLADEMGYGSDAAFNRAFTKEFGYPPKRYGLTKAGSARRGATA